MADPVGRIVVRANAFHPGGDPVTGSSATTGSKPVRHGRWSVGVVLGGAMGLLPHLLHHVGLLAGTALLAGIGGTVLFGVLGLAAMVPMLLRLRRRFGAWWAPGVALALFAVMFAVTAFSIGPALRSTVDGPSKPGHAPSAPSSGEHARHHG